MTEEIQVDWGAPLPKATRKKKGSKYDPIINEFMNRPDETARITISGVQPNAVASGLKHAIKIAGLGERIQVSNRGDAGVWLIKVTARSQPDSEGAATF